MKITFLCTSLAAGRDGVGDYARQLANACTAAGHTCRLIAVNDRQLRGDRVVEEADGVTRLPALLSWEARTAAVQKAIHDFDPDWVSWQLVPYGFHPKGLMPAGSTRLAHALRGRRHHVMLHELWIGLTTRETLRARMMGAWQRRRLLAFLAALRPNRVHTSNGAYEAVLKSHGLTAGRLPLFSNIEIAPPAANHGTSFGDTLGRALPAGPHWLGTFFGTVHPQWQPGPTISWLRRAAELAGRSLALLAMGRIGEHGQSLLARISREFPDITVIDAGTRSPASISRFLQGADFGIATHPWALIEKSGSTATFLEHGLPVLVPRDDWVLRSGVPVPGPSDPLLRRLADLEPEQFPNWLALRRPPDARLPAIAHQFLAELGEPTRRCASVA